MLIIVIPLNLKVDFLLVTLLDSSLAFCTKDLHIFYGIVNCDSHQFALLFVVLTDDFFVTIPIFPLNSLRDCQSFAVFEEDELDKVEKG